MRHSNLLCLAWSRAAELDMRLMVCLSGLASCLHDPGCGTSLVMMPSAKHRCNKHNDAVPWRS